jgi:hypothetical protein
MFTIYKGSGKKFRCLLDYRDGKPMTDMGGRFILVQNV